MHKDPWAKRRTERQAREAAEQQAAMSADAHTQEQMKSLLLKLSGMTPEELKGAPGAPGAPGGPGKDGSHGLNGKDGRDGHDGVNGLDGRHGQDGKDGLKGDKGDPGAHAVRSMFRRDDTGQRIEAVVEYLSDGSERTFHVQRDDRGRPVELILDR